MRTAATVLGLALAAAIAGSAGANAAELYKWTDEQGQVHYTDTPPPEGAKFEARAVEETPDTKPEESPAAMAAAKAKENAKKAESPSCQQARANVTVLETNPQVRKDLDGDGEAETLTAEQHSAELTRARELVKLMCQA